MIARCNSAIQVAGPLLVRVDPLAISRILGNLLDNAAIHSPAGSPIWVAGRRDGRQAVLAVQDQGPGVPAAEHDRIFQRYVQLQEGTRRDGGGLGLGLYIARRLAHANHGDLLVTAPPGGRGAHFELRLPLASPGTDPTGPPPLGGASHAP